MVKGVSVTATGGAEKPHLLQATFKFGDKKEACESSPLGPALIV